MAHHPGWVSTSKNQISKMDFKSPRGESIAGLTLSVPPGKFLSSHRGRLGSADEYRQNQATPQHLPGIRVKERRRGLVPGRAGEWQGGRKKGGSIQKERGPSKGLRAGGSIPRSSAGFLQLCPPAQWNLCSLTAPGGEDTASPAQHPRHPHSRLPPLSLGAQHGCQHVQ